MGMDIEQSDLVAAYFEYFRSGFEESLMWAWETFHVMPLTPSDYFDLVLALLEGAPNAYCVELVGADALEHILWKSGDEVIEAVEAEATHNPRLRGALWIVDGLSDRPALEARVRRILGEGPRPKAVERPADWAPPAGRPPIRGNPGPRSSR
jgi:hypothetical protein